MSEQLSMQRPRVISTILALIGFCILIGLGVWQLQRLKWKEGLLAHIEALHNAPARSLNQVMARGGDLDYVRVSFACPNLMTAPRARVYGIQDGQIAYHQMVACPLPAGLAAGSVLVDIGYEDCASDKPIPPFSGELVGILRKPDARTFVTPPDQPQTMLWYWRDLTSMAQALKAGPPAPLFLALERGPQPASGCRLARAAIPQNLPNRHLEYAITWFGLAAALVGVYVASLFRKRQP
jgi:surfeit locus 1 family protein